MSSTATEIRELKKQISNLENEAKKTVKQGSNVISAPALERFAHNAGETVREFYDDKPAR